MATWRYISYFVSDMGRLITRPYPIAPKSEDEGLSDLREFLENRMVVYGDSLRWVALQRSNTGAARSDSTAKWQELKRLLPLSEI